MVGLEALNFAMGVRLAPLEPELVRSEKLQ